MSYLRFVTCLTFFLSLFVCSYAYSQVLPKLKFVAVHQVDGGIYVHTYSIEGPTIQQSSDKQPKAILSEEINSLNNLLLTINEVSESSFDSATSTFTIVSSKETIEKEIERLTQKK